MTWLVTGGAGYIGCHVVRTLHTAGSRVVALDDLSTGKPDRLPDDVRLEVGSTLDQGALDRVYKAEQFDGVVHLAAQERVGESVVEPSRYFEENVEGLRKLLDRCDRAGVRNFLFSSSGAVYGSSDSEAVDEDVADAHAAAVPVLERGSHSAATLNIGTGRGVSVRSIVDAALRVTGSSIEPISAPRREGDVAALVARVDKAREVLEWSAKHTVSDMLSSAWQATAVSTP